MEGPEAGVLAAAIIGGFVTITTAIIRFKPRTHFNGKGELLAKAVDVVEIRGRLTVLEAATTKESEYNHASTHRINNQLHRLQLTQALMDQKLDMVCDRLRIKRMMDCDDDSEVDGH